MSASEEFKQKIQAGEIFEALTLAMSEATELEVTTWVSKIPWEDSQPQPGDYLRTRINLVGGEIENEIGSKFIENEGSNAILDLHLHQVKEGHQTVLNNLESLQKMFVVLTSILQELPQNSARSLPEDGYHGN